MKSIRNVMCGLLMALAGFVGASSVFAGEPMAGVSIVVTESPSGTVTEYATDENGEFKAVIGADTNKIEVCADLHLTILCVEVSAQNTKKTTASVDARHDDTIMLTLKPVRSGKLKGSVTLEVPEPD